MATSTVSQHALAIDISWPTADADAFHPCPPHPRFDPLDDQRAFEFSQHGDDHDERAAEKAAGVELLPLADELDMEVVEFVQHFNEVPDRTCQPIAAPHYDDIEASATSVGQ